MLPAYQISGAWKAPVGGRGRGPPIRAVRSFGLRLVKGSKGPGEGHCPRGTRPNPAHGAHRSRAGSGNQGNWTCARVQARHQGRLRTDVGPPGRSVGWRAKGLRGVWPGEVACLRATHRQVKEQFVGPLAGLVSRQVIGLVGWRAEAGRCGGEAQVVEASSRAQPSGSAGRPPDACLPPACRGCDADRCRHRQAR
jgi:hypothetical protein